MAPSMATSVHAQRASPPPSRYSTSSSSSSSSAAMASAAAEALLKFCARSVMCGISAGVSFYALSKLDAELLLVDKRIGDLNHQCRRRNHPKSGGEERTEASGFSFSTVLAVLRSNDPAARDRIWRAVRDRLPMLTWMSLFACLLDDSKAFGGPHRIMVISMALQLLVPPLPPLPSSADDGVDGLASDNSTRTADDKPENRSQARIQKPLDDVGPSSSSTPSRIVSPPRLRAGRAQRHVELLVHNVSHTDMILSLERDPEVSSCEVDIIAPSSSMDQSFVQVAVSPVTPRQHARSTSAGASGGGLADDPYCLVRPRFSCFEKYSRMVWDHLAGSDDIVLYFERYSRNEESHALDPDATLEETATGLRLSAADRMPPVDLHEVRVRGRDQDKARGVCRIRHVFFPLLATLLPRWKEMIQEKQYDSAANVKKVLILVSGVGTPRNWTHDRMGNSTATCARVMKAFLERIDPTITVVHIHSETNIFRYDENLVFSEKELMPIIHSYRDAHARGLAYPDEAAGAHEPREDDLDVSLRTHPFSADWRGSFHTTLSFADGSPARTYAIQASLRQYRPNYFHLWQLKTFWHESKIVNDDIEVHSFEAMETIPPVDIRSCTDPMAAKVIHEMKIFKEEMVRTLASDNDIRRFWLRKTHKPVIAVLLVHSDGSDDDPVLYRGTNMEVSMPTGSLCAERNVIGTALADRPGLKREDLKLIAVLAVPMEEVGIHGLPPADASGIRRVNSCIANIDVSLASLSARRASFGSEDDREWILPFPKPEAHSSETLGSDVAFTPRRTVSLVSKSHAANMPASKRTVVLRGTHRDLNPLRPCGACNEWLKKIAECNPYFKILTFTDSECNGVYITPCQD